MSTFEIDISRAIGGDSEAFSRVVEQSASTVCSIAMAIVRDVPASEEIAQDVFVAVWKNLSRLRNERSFLPWLRQITRNQARTRLRALRAQPQTEELAPSIPDSRKNAVEELLTNEEHQTLQRVLDDLPDESREVLLLYYREGNSTAHVAALLGLSEPAVRQRISRARARVREEMLEAFGKSARNSAPGAALVAGVIATTTAPASSAAAVSASAASASKPLLFAKAAGFGTLLGAFGVFMSFVHLGSPMDEEEARGMRRLGRDALLIVVTFCVLLPLAVQLPHRRIWMLTLYLFYLGGMGALYRVRVPRILARRTQDEHSASDMWKAISAATAGGILYFILYKILFL